MPLPAEAAGSLDLGWPALVAATLVLSSCVGGMITAAKGRWGWLCLGLLTGGLAWPLTALLIATPGSVWAQAFYGPPKMSRAKRAFAGRRRWTSRV
jgi:hypothetical protein